MTDIELPADTCPHAEFHAQCNVLRLVDQHDESKVTGFAVDIRVTCTQCGIPFEWMGLAVGSSPAQPMVSLDGLDLRAPIRPQGSTMAPVGPAFTIRPRIGAARRVQ
jgi:hypothetical protein